MKLCISLSFGGEVKVLRFYFSDEGRMNRKQFLLAGLLPLGILSQLLLILLCSVPHIRLPSQQPQQSTFLGFVLVLSIVIFFLMSVLNWSLGQVTAKRAQDAQVPGHWGIRIFFVATAYAITSLVTAFGLDAAFVSSLCLLALVLLLGILAVIPGSAGENAFGPPSSPSAKSHGKAFE